MKAEILFRRRKWQNNIKVGGYVKPTTPLLPITGRLPLMRNLLCHFNSYPLLFSSMGEIRSKLPAPLGGGLGKGVSSGNKPLCHSLRKWHLPLCLRGEWIGKFISRESLTHFGGDLGFNSYFFELVHCSFGFAELILFIWLCRARHNAWHDSSVFARPKIVCSFLLLAQKKWTKEKGSLKSFLGLTFFRLPTHYNSLSANWRIAQTVMLTRPNASQPSKCYSFSKKDLMA